MRSRRSRHVLRMGGILGIAGAVAGFAAGPALGAASPWSDTEYAAVRLVSTAETVGDQEIVTLGLHFRMDDGWKIYWRSPGDAGFPPTPEWTGSENLSQAELQWPAPERFSVLGFETLGYKHEVVLPLAATLSEPGQPLRLRANLTFLACDEICIPYQTPLVLDLPSGPPQAAVEAHLVNRFSALVPDDGSAHGLTVGGLALTGAGEEAVIQVAATSATPFVAPDLFVEGPPELAFGKPRTALSRGNRRALLTVPVSGLVDLESPLIGRTVVVTLIDGERSAERPIAVAASLALEETGGTAPSLLAILAFAVLGGLILNLMPCVLPVLSIKILGVIGHGGADRGLVRVSFLASAAGILTAFLALAGVLIALGAAGASVGWGIQFQHPWFLAAMALLVTFFACNLWGFFEVSVPGWAARWSEDTAHVKGLAGHFLAGVFATLLATPCSAPFLGTAVGFALSQGWPQILAVFAALGTGLALPYLLLAAAPGLATGLPRPGPWMVRVKQVLGFLLAATAAWLLSVLWVQSGSAVALVTAVALVILSGLLLARHRGLSSRIAGPALAAAAIVAFAAPAWWPQSPSEPATTHEADALWQPFDEAAIAALVAEGRTVFVDVTADWCITCKANKALVLQRGEVFDRLTAPGVIAMQADWTRPNDTIARYLADHGRYGIPFNAVYGPGSPRGDVLPELLTGSGVLDALDRADPNSAVAGR